MAFPLFWHEDHGNPYTCSGRAIKAKLRIFAIRIFAAVSDAGRDHSRRWTHRLGRSLRTSEAGRIRGGRFPWSVIDRPRPARYRIALAYDVCAKHRLRPKGAAAGGHQRA